ncbi:unnamed protein product [Camellia sinensis]
MEITIIKAEKDGQKKEDSLQSTSTDKKLPDDRSLSKRPVKKVKPKDVLVLNVRQQSQSGESCIRNSFLRNIRSLESRIPKQIVSLDEKYLWHCLELIYASAAKAASCNIPESLGYLQMGNLSDHSSSLKIRNSVACNLTKFAIGCPLEAGTGNVLVNPVGEWIVGTITGSKSIMNLLKSPLFHQFGAAESDINFGRTNLIDDMKSVGSNFTSSPGWLSISASQKLEKKAVVLKNDRYGSEPVHKRLISVSSTNSISSDQTSSVSIGITQAMLHCTWKSGFPHYVFSVDDQKEVYVANLVKVDSPDNTVFDYMYMFHGGRKEYEVHTNESDLVGKMRVSTKYTHCPNNSEIKETQFVLFGSDASSVGEKQPSSHTLKKHKGLSRKMVEVFKPSHPSRARSSSKFAGTTTIFENSTKPCSDSLGAAKLSDNYLPPNLELAAIVVKDHICGSGQEAEIGGWGMKFLKKVETRQTVASVEASPSDYCLRNTSDCSTCVDILIPAGFHGGPTNRIGGPSSLIERWRSGGRCDCGGWDIGCPLTVFNTRPSEKEALPQADMPGDCRSFELFIQGSTQCATPIMKMMNIRDGLYFINYQSTLSALQSFSIAVAIIHTQSPALQPKVYRS